MPITWMPWEGEMAYKGKELACILSKLDIPKGIDTDSP